MSRDKEDAAQGAPSQLGHTPVTDLHGSRNNRRGRRARNRIGGFFLVLFVAIAFAVLGSLNSPYKHNALRKTPHVVESKKNAFPIEVKSNLSKRTLHY